MSRNQGTMGSRLAGWRRAQKITQEVAAKHAGISVRYLSKIENDRAKPAASVIASLVSGIGAPADYILTGAVDGRSNPADRPFAEPLREP